LSFEEASVILEATNNFIKLGVQGKRLDSLKTLKDESVSTRFQAMLEVRMMTELHVIAAFGFETSQMGLMAFRQTMGALLQSTQGTELQSLHRLDQNIWYTILERSFAVTPKPIEVAKAREAVFMVTSQFQQNTFLDELKEGVAAIGTDAPDADKKKVLDEMLLQVWKEVLPGFGFTGDDGYVQFQAALVEHNADQQISTMLQSAQMSVMQRALQP